MPWSYDSPPSPIKNKSKGAIKVGVDAANEALKRGRTEAEAIFAAIAAAANYEKVKSKDHAVKKSQEEQDRLDTLPSHLSAILAKRKEVVKQLEDIPSVQKEVPKIRKEFLGKNALEVLKDRNVVSADFNNRNQLEILFDTGEKIVTREISIEEFVENNVGYFIDQLFDKLAFNTNVDYNVAVGELAWNQVDGTLDLGLAGGNVVLQVGQEEVVHIYNNTNAAFTEPQVIRVTGSQGQRLTAALAQANGEMTSATTFALVTEPIAKNQEGFATVSGLVRNVDTSAFTEGAALYLSPTIPGGITQVRPSAPNHTVLVGWCVRSHHVLGSIYVHVQNGQELDELHNVNISNPQNGQVLAYDASTQVWRNQNAGSATGSDLSYLHTQNTAASTWTINHNLGKYPSVTVVDSAGDQVEGDVNYPGLNQATVTFSAPFSGRAFLN